MWLCTSVDRVVEIHAEIPRPDPTAIAERYRDLSEAYAIAAGALGDDQAAESTSELAAWFDQGTGILDEHADADRERLDELFEETDVLVALEERMAIGEVLGFTSRAWDEIDSRCEAPIDPGVSP